MSTAEHLQLPGAGLAGGHHTGTPERVILVHASANAANIAERLGMADYSYYFVMREFLPALERLGKVIVVDDPAREVDAIHAEHAARGVPCVFLSFSPPHKTPLGLACPTVPVFAWEFEDIPSDVSPGGLESDWTRPLGRLGCAITHSRFAVDAVRRAIRPDYPIVSVVAPVWERFDALRAQPPKRSARSPISFTIPGPLLDSRALDTSGYAPRYAKRAMGVPDDQLEPPPIEPLSAAEVPFDDVVYTAVLNPYDSRKNWWDLLGVFCETLRDAPDATLILKLTHRDPREACYAILEELYKLAPIRCRVIVQYGFLGQPAYDALIGVTDYVVNTSHGEGQCLPVMEFMSCGRPAIAPTHTAFAEYIDETNAFPIGSTREPARWPHDPRQVYRTLCYRIDPESLARAYERSYRIAKLEPDVYHRMSAAALRTMASHCSLAAATAKLRRFLAMRLGENAVFGTARVPRPLARHIAGTVARAAALRTRENGDGPATIDSPAHAPPAVTGAGAEVFGKSTQSVVEPAAKRTVPPRLDWRARGLLDAVESGWYRRETGELFTGFPITAEDVVLDVGCGDGGVARFCASLGARVLFLDIGREKVRRAVREFPEFSRARHLPLVGDAQQLPLADGVATRVYSMDVLEHLEDPARALAEMQRVGAPGALYLISVPDPVTEHAQKGLAPAGYFQKPNHIHIFEREVFARLVADAGLVIERHESMGFFWSMALMLYWAARNNEPAEGTEMLSLLALEPPEVVQRWADTWSALMELPGAANVIGAFNRVLPKSQIIVARKPS